jgi:hypothetical protein
MNISDFNLDSLVDCAASFQISEKKPSNSCSISDVTWQHSVILAFFTSEKPFAVAAVSSRIFFIALKIPVHNAPSVV